MGTNSGSTVRGKAMLRFREDGLTIAVEKGHGDYQAFREGIFGSRFDPIAKEWFIASYEHAYKIVARLQGLGFDVLQSPRVREIVVQEEAKLQKSVVYAAERLAKIEEKLAAKGRALFDYQHEDVLWLSSRRRSINCLEPGLGKTCTTLCSLPDSKDIGVLVIGPAIAKGVWRYESSVWRDEFKVTVLKGRGSFRFPERGEIVVINFDLLPDEKELPKAKLKHDLVVVVDEAHLVAKKGSKRSKRVAAIVKRADYATFLTGTPLPNMPAELWSLLLMLDLAHEAFGTYAEFVRCFQGVEKHYFVKKLLPNGEPMMKWEEDEETGEQRQVHVMEKKHAGYDWGDPLPEAGERLKRVLVRHTKEDVKNDIPERLYRIIEVDIDDVKLRRQLDMEVEALGVKLEDVDDIGEDGLFAADKVSVEKIPFTKLSKARALLAAAKLEAMKEFIDDYEEALGDDIYQNPLIAFSYFRAPVDAAAKRAGWESITGDTSEKNRVRIQEAFQAGSLRGISATIQAAATAITLTRAPAMLFSDLSYVPAHNEQAMCRAHRIGQTRGVVITFLVAKHPIDNRLFEIVSKKLNINALSIERARERKKVGLADLVPTTVKKVEPKVGARPPIGDEAKYIEHLSSLVGFGDRLSFEAMAAAAANGPKKLMLLPHHRQSEGLIAEFALTGALTRVQWQIVSSFAKKYA